MRFTICVEQVLAYYRMKEKIIIINHTNTNVEWTLLGTLKNTQRRKRNGPRWLPILKKDTKDTTGYYEFWKAAKELMIISRTAMQRN